MLKIEGNCLVSADENIVNAVIPEYVTEIKPRAFKKCKKLVSVEILGPVKILPEECFISCADITNVNVGIDCTCS